MMSLLPRTKLLFSAVKGFANGSTNATGAVRNLMSKQLVYCEFGDPLNVVKFRECEVPPLDSQEVLVRMLAAPVNPADINTIQGTNMFWYYSFTESGFYNIFECYWEKNYVS